MRKITFALLSCLSIGTFSHAATIEYRLLVNGEDLSSAPLAAGTHTLTVEGRVTNNELAPSTPGGFIQASFDLIKDSAGITFVQGKGFLGADNGLWDSTTNAKFGNHNAGAIDASGNVIQETGSILPANWNADFGAVGTNVWSMIASGPFMYDGSSAVNITLSSAAGVNLVSALNGANVGSRIPNGANDSVTGDTVLVGIPEPGTIALASLSLIGLAVRRRIS